MIFKFDGIDGCGKSTLIEEVSMALSPNYRVAEVNEFGDTNDILYSNAINNTSISEILRTIVVNETSCLDDVEREFLWATMSRRTNRIVIPKLLKDYDVILVNRSEIGNYCYGLSINLAFQPIYQLALSDLVFDHKIFWLDIPPNIAYERIQKRGKKLSYNETKGIPFLELVQNRYMKFYTAQKNIIRLDARLEVEILKQQVLDIILANI